MDNWWEQDIDQEAKELSYELEPKRSILSNVIRIGNFSSSEITRLKGNGTRKMTAEEKAELKKVDPKSRKQTIECSSVLSKPALTYIEEKRMERRLGRPLGLESNARTLKWGHALEPYANAKNGNVIYSSNETHVHSNYDFWVGSRDYQRGLDTVGEYKCPFTLKSFIQLVQPLYDGLEGMDAINWIRENHPDGEKYYDQIVSNACIGGFKYGELAVYMPYKNDLEQMKKDFEGDGTMYWFCWATDEELPYLIEGGEFKDFNVIRFEIPQEDKELLELKVKQAGELLLK